MKNTGNRNHYWFLSCKKWPIAFVLFFILPMKWNSLSFLTCLMPKSKHSTLLDGLVVERSCGVVPTPGHFKVTHCFPAWQSLLAFGLGVGGVVSPKSCHSPQGGGGGSNAEDKFHIIWNVTISRMTASKHNSQMPLVEGNGQWPITNR